MNKTSIGIERRRLNSCGLAGLVLAGVTCAASAQQAVTDDILQEIVVTGSRIERELREIPAPTILVDEDFLTRNGGLGDLGLALAQQPSMGYGGTATTAQNEGTSGGTRGETTGGLSRADLRRLGPERTLVLVDGKRRVAGNFGSSAVDLNTVIPATIERVEIITGGASAVYGSDAVAGVVNIITRRDFEGLSFYAHGSSPIDGGFGESYGLGLMAGTSFSESRGHVMVAAEYNKRNAVSGIDLRLPNYGQAINPANGSATDGIPDRILTANTASELNNGAGVFGTRNDTGTLGRFTFSDSGARQALPTRVATVDSNFASFSTECGVYCFRLADYVTFVPEQDRTNVGVKLAYELAPAVEFYGDFSYLQGSSIGLGQPNLSAGTGLPINITSNAFLDEDLRAELLAQGRTTVALTRAWMDVGPRYSAADRESVSSVLGVRGTLENSISDVNYDAYYQYGETDVRYIGYNRMLSANLSAALDAVVDPATGAIRCRMDVPALQPPGYVAPAVIGAASCAPFNPFGGANASQSALDYVRVNTVRTAEITQTVGGAVLSGNLSKLFSFPGGGALRYAGGVEYREEGSESFNDGLLQGNFILSNSTVLNAKSRFDVEEWFVELSMPVLQDLPFANLLVLDGAVRTADYSHAGSATSWKAGLVWEPVGDLRLRGTVGSAVRAPNMVEAFRPAESQATGISDPCSQENIQANAYRASNCAVLGRPENWVNPTGGLAIPATAQGNANLRPEESDSWTAGIVLTPRFMQGLTVSLDWFDIEIEDAISFVSLQSTVNNCVDRPGGPDADFCSLVTRNSNASDPFFFRIEGGQVTYVNASRLTTSGLDVALNYAMPLGAGNLSLMLTGTYTDELKNYPFQQEPQTFTDLVGYLTVPEYAGILSASFALNAWTFTWQGRAQSSVSLISTAPGASQEALDVKDTGSLFYNDIYVAYDWVRPSNGAARFYLGARNIFDEDLPKMITQTAIQTGGAFDFMGASVYAGVKWDF